MDIDICQLSVQTLKTTFFVSDLIIHWALFGSDSKNDLEIIYKLFLKKYLYSKSLIFLTIKVQKKI